MEDDEASLSDPDETIADRAEPGGLLEPEEVDTNEKHLPEALHEKEGATIAETIPATEGLFHEET